MSASFGISLRRHRIAAGLTQEELAGRAGLSAQAVGALERGERRFPRRDTVDRLADALGPSPDERAELAETSSRRGKPRATGTPVPRQLPPRVAHFTGREAHIDTVVELLADSSVVLSGMGGVGKTALAVHVGHLVAERFPDGRLYLDLRDGLPPHEALARLLRSIGVPGIPHDLAEAASAFRSALADRRVLLVLDDAANADQVRPLLPGAPGSAAIITSRRALDALPHVRHVRLDVLTSLESRRLLTAPAGDRVAAEPDAAADIARLCGRLPLAIRLAGARLAARTRWPVAHVAQRLADEHRRLDELELDDTGVRASFAVSFDDLTEADAVAYALLALPDGPDVSLPVAARLLDRSEDDAERLLERLTDRHLLEPAAPGHYRMHDLLRVHARETPVPQRERAAALGRATALFVAVAWRGLGLVLSDSVRQSWADERWTDGGPDFPGSAEAFAWLDRHRHHLVGLARTPGVPAEQLTRLAPGLMVFYLSRGHWLDWSQVAQAALDAPNPDPFGRAIIRMDLGIALADLAHAWSDDFRPALAHLRRGLAEFRALGHHRATAACLTNLGEVLELCGDLAAAVECVEESLATSRELALPCGEAAASEYLGGLYRKPGRPDRELACYQASLRLNEQLGHDRDRAGVLCKIGAAHRHAGRPDEATSALDRSRALFHAVGDPAGEATALEELARVKLDHNDRAGAHEALRAALRLAEKYDDRPRRAELVRLLDATRPS